MPSVITSYSIHYTKLYDTIYEGTTAIQANDLIGRKIARESGMTIKAVIEEMRGVVAELEAQESEEMNAIRAALSGVITSYSIHYTKLYDADVRRLLMSMRSQTEAMRAVAYVVASATDVAHNHPDDGERARAQAFVDP